MGSTHRNLLWIFVGSLKGALYRASTLETTSELYQLGWHITLVAADLPDEEVNPQNSGDED